MTSDSQFNAIRPYIGEEIPAAVERLSQAEEFLTLFSQMTRVDKSKIQEQLKGITSREQFQAQFFGPTIQRLIAGQPKELQLPDWNTLRKIRVIFSYPTTGTLS